MLFTVEGIVMKISKSNVTLSDIEKAAALIKKTGPELFIVKCACGGTFTAAKIKNSRSFCGHCQKHFTGKWENKTGIFILKK